MRTRGVFRAKAFFFRFLQHPRADHCSLTAMLPQNFSNHQPVTCSGHAFSFFSAFFWPAMGWFGVSTWLQGLLSCSDSMVGSQRGGERENVIDGLKMLDICMSALWHLGKSQRKINSSATVLLLHQTHFL